MKVNMVWISIIGPIQATLTFVDLHLFVSSASKDYCSRSFSFDKMGWNHFWRCIHIFRSTVFLQSFNYQVIVYKRISWKHNGHRCPTWTKQEIWIIESKSGLMYNDGHITYSGLFIKHCLVLLLFQVLRFDFCDLNAPESERFVCLFKGRITPLPDESNPYL